MRLPVPSFTGNDLRVNVMGAGCDGSRCGRVYFGRIARVASVPGAPTGRIALEAGEAGEQR